MCELGYFNCTCIPFPSAFAATAAPTSIPALACQPARPFFSHRDAGHCQVGYLLQLGPGQDVPRLKCLWLILIHWHFCQCEVPRFAKLPSSESSSQARLKPAVASLRVFVVNPHTLWVCFEPLPNVCCWRPRFSELWWLNYCFCEGVGIGAVGNPFFGGEAVNICLHLGGREELHAHISAHLDHPTLPS